ncbi:hypothetical protein Hanom_Chr16g01452071 [Helianthus anomalus]
MALFLMISWFEFWMLIPPLDLRGRRFKPSSSVTKVLVRQLLNTSLPILLWHHVPPWMNTASVSKIWRNS